jgi:cytochrome oxidase Cu insertion factor (SCO1/SenC/PrrC family)
MDQFRQARSPSFCAIATLSRIGDAPVSMQIGNRVSDATFVQADGSPLTLASFAGRPVLLIFLRHLA